MFGPNGLGIHGLQLFATNDFRLCMFWTLVFCLCQGLAKLFSASEASPMTDFGVTVRPSFAGFHSFVWQHGFGFSTRGLISPRMPPSLDTFCSCFYVACACCVRTGLVGSQKCRFCWSWNMVILSCWKCLIFLAPSSVDSWSFQSSNYAFIAPCILAILAA